MAFDYKKEYKEFYLPPKNPGIIEIPEMNYVAVRGTGDPNEENGEYKKAIGLLYGISFTIKMSYKGPYSIEGYFSYVVPPLEGLWWQEGSRECIDYGHKDAFQWITMIRLPDFVKKGDFEWAVKEASAKKKMDFSKVEFFTYEEEICVQCMHTGSYDSEMETIQKMKKYASDQGYEPDYSHRFHHEIYLSDPRRTAVEKLRTVIRNPVRKINDRR